MRSENEMYKLFLDIGSDDERIVAIYAARAFLRHVNTLSKDAKEIY